MRVAIILGHTNSDHILSHAQAFTPGVTSIFSFRGDFILNLKDLGLLYPEEAQKKYASLSASNYSGIFPPPLLIFLLRFGLDIFFLAN